MIAKKKFYETKNNDKNENKNLKHKKKASVKKTKNRKSISKSNSKINKGQQTLLQKSLSKKSHQNLNGNHSPKKNNKNAKIIKNKIKKKPNEKNQKIVNDEKLLKKLLINQQPKIRKSVSKKKVTIKKNKNLDKVPDNITKKQKQSSTFFLSRKKSKTKIKPKPKVKQVVMRNDVTKNTSKQTQQKIPDVNITKELGITKKKFKNHLQSYILDSNNSVPFEKQQKNSLVFQRKTSQMIIGQRKHDQHIMKKVSCNNLEKRKKLKKCKSCVNTNKIRKLNKSETKKNLKTSLQQQQNKQKLKIVHNAQKMQNDKTKAKLVRNKNQNSLKDLFEQYNKMKKIEQQDFVDEKKLSAMREKVDYVYQQIQSKIQNFKKNNQKFVLDRAVLKKRNQAAIVIQKYMRGYLVRKFMVQARLSYRKSQIRKSVQNQEDKILSKQKTKKSLLKDSKRQIQNKFNSKIKIRKDSDKSCRNNSDLKRFVFDEFQRWKQLNFVLSNLNNYVKQKNQSNQQVEDMLHQMKSITQQNIVQIKRKFYSKNFKISNNSHDQQITSKDDQSSNKTFKKQEMEIWPVKNKKDGNSQTMIKSYLFEETRSLDKVFYTDRNLQEFEKIQIQSPKTQSPQQSITEEQQTKPLQQKKSDKIIQIQKQELNQQKIVNIEDIEITKSNSSNENQIPKKMNQQQIDLIGVAVEDMLIQNFIEDDLWNTLILIAIQQQTDIQDQDTVLGIRTNINSINEYSNLLITYLKQYYEQISINLVKVRTQYKKQTQQYHKNQYNQFQQKEIKTPKFIQIIPEHLFHQLEEEILKNYQNLDIDEQLFIMQKGYHKCIFDSFNEILYDLICNQKYFQNTLIEINCIKLNNYGEQEMFFILQKSKSILINNAMLLCGILRDKEDSLLDQSLKELNDETWNLLREEKMFKFLFHENIQKKDVEFKKINQNKKIEIKELIFE